MTAAARPGRSLALPVGLTGAALAAGALLALAALPHGLALALGTTALALALAAVVLAVSTARRRGVESAAVQELLAQAAHQLRTPTATLSLELETVLADPGTDAATAELARRLTPQVEAQGELLDHLLASARAAARTAPPQPIDPGPLLEEVHRVLDPVAAAQGSVLVTDARLPHLVGRREDLRELLVILGENALRHGGGDARIELREQGRSVAVTVTDAGLSTGRHRGAGLGLELARRIVARHRGSLVIDAPTASTPGHRVRVLLPRRKVGARRRP